MSQAQLHAAMPSEPTSSPNARQARLRVRVANLGSLSRDGSQSTSALKKLEQAYFAVLFIMLERTSNVRCAGSARCAAPALALILTDPAASHRRLRSLRPRTPAPAEPARDLHAPRIRALHRAIRQFAGAL